MADIKRFTVRYGVDNNNNTITNVALPVNDTDAANKQFAKNASNITTGTLSVARLPMTTSAGTYGSNTKIPRFTVDQFGRIITAESIDINFNVPVNYAFQNIFVSGEENISATSNTDFLTFVPGDGVVITTDRQSRQITISSVNGGGGGGGGSGESAVLLTAGERLNAGDFVYVDESGQVRKAGASIAPAVGFVKVTTPVTQQCLVYRGLNDKLMSLTPGSRLYLSETPGEATQTPLVRSGALHQYLGTAHSTTSVIFEDEEFILLT